MKNTDVNQFVETSMLYLDSKIVMMVIFYLMMVVMIVVINVFSTVLIVDWMFVMSVTQLVGLIIIKHSYVFLFVEMERLMDMNNVMMGI